MRQSNIRAIDSEQQQHRVIEVLTKQKITVGSATAFTSVVCPWHGHLGNYVAHTKHAENQKHSGKVQLSARLYEQKMKAIYFNQMRKLFGFKRTSIKF